MICNLSFVRNPDFELIWSSCRHQRFSFPENTEYDEYIRFREHVRERERERGERERERGRGKEGEGEGEERQLSFIQLKYLGWSRSAMFF